MRDREAKAKRRQPVRIVEVLVVLGILGAVVLPMLERRQEAARGSAGAAEVGETGEAGEGPADVGFAEEEGPERGAGAEEGATPFDIFRVVGFIAMGVIVIAFFGKQLLAQRKRGKRGRKKR